MVKAKISEFIYLIVTISLILSLYAQRRMFLAREAAMKAVFHREMSRITDSRTIRTLFGPSGVAILKQADRAEVFVVRRAGDPVAGATAPTTVAGFPIKFTGRGLSEDAISAISNILLDSSVYFPSSDTPHPRLGIKVTRRGFDGELYLMFNIDSGNVHVWSITTIGNCPIPLGDDWSECINSNVLYSILRDIEHGI